MYTLKSISEILDADLLDADNKENNIINDFEYQMLHVKSTQTAFISISKTSWQNYLNKSKVMNDGNSQIPKDVKEIGLIITESYVEGLAKKIPQIVVKNSIKAMKILALYIRKNYRNPIVCITGSMGKSSTRLMLTAALAPLKVQENRGNSNTRSAIYLHMCKLAANPDIAIFETSLNALNNRGNMASVLKPDIAIVTGIGSAHLSTIGSTEEIAEYKSRIFA
ncbi:Mur ligase family protein, partial [Staphylococcus carnosus]